MEPLIRITARAAVLARDNVDTDQSIPGRFLRKPREPGYHHWLFHDLRRRADGGLDPDFVLNRAADPPPRILIAGRNFGCGSSREGAVYALVDAGFRVILAAGFGDIFRGNCRKNGVLAAVLAPEAVARLGLLLAGAPEAPVTVDLDACKVSLSGGPVWPLEVDPFTRDSLLAGRDDIAMTLAESRAIDAAFEDALDREPWLDQGASSGTNLVP